MVDSVRLDAIVQAAVVFAICRGSHVQEQEPLITPLPLCAGSGAAATVEQLLQMQADCRAADVIDRTPLHAAAASGYRCERRKTDPDVHAFADPHHLPACGKSCGASRRGQKQHLPSVKVPLSLAQMTWRLLHSGIAARLLAAGAPPAALDRGRRTPLHWAALNGHSSTVRVLADALQVAESDWHAQVPHNTAHGNTKDHAYAATAEVVAARGYADAQH